MNESDRTRSSTRGLLGAAVFAVLPFLAGCLSLDRDPNELAVGATAPDFRLQSEEGRAVALADLRAQGRPVLVFYRGDW